MYCPIPYPGLFSIVNRFHPCSVKVKILVLSEPQQSGLGFRNALFSCPRGATGSPCDSFKGQDVLCSGRAGMAHPGGKGIREATWSKPPGSRRKTAGEAPSRQRKHRNILLNRTPMQPIFEIGENESGC